ncbi:MAG: OmpA family protein [Pseudomonas sp.]
MRRALVLPVLSTLTTLLAAPAVAKHPDHPLISRYPETRATQYERVEYERFRLPSGLAEETGAEFPTLDLVGDLSRHTYEIKGVSTLKLFENYRSALQRSGFESLFSCEAEACGASREVRRMADPLAVTGNVYNQYHKPYYLLARQQAEGGAVHVAVFIGGHGDAAAVQQVVIQERPQADQLISVDQTYLTQDETSGETPEISAEERAKDHPLLSRYPGAHLRKRERSEYEAFTLPMPVDAEIPPMALIGDLTRHTYELRNVSTLKLQENYDAALLSAGFELVYACDLRACGDGRASKALGDQLAIDKNVYNNYHNRYYRIYRRDSSQGEVHAAVFIGGYGEQAAVQQVIVEGRGADTDLIQISAEGLHADLEVAGKALIYGIYFDTDKSEVKAESAPALQAIAELLKQHPELRLYVVGHTDDTGSEQHNQRLSAARASAVVDALQRDHAVAAGRLSPAGVGPYAPAAGNSNEAGRELNRRVELVQRLR